MSFMGIWPNFVVTQRTFGATHAQAAIDYANLVEAPPVLRAYGEGLTIVGVVAAQKRFRSISEHDRVEYALTIIEKLFRYYKQQAQRSALQMIIWKNNYTSDNVRELFGYFFNKAQKEAIEIREQYFRRVNKLKTSFIESPDGSVQKTPAKFADTVHVMPLDLNLTPEQRFFQSAKEAMQTAFGLSPDDLSGYDHFSFSKEE